MVEINSSMNFNSQRKEMKLLDAAGYLSVHRAMYENAGASLPQYVLNPGQQLTLLELGNTQIR